MDVLLSGVDPVTLLTIGSRQVCETPNACFLFRLDFHCLLISNDLLRAAKGTGPENQAALFRLRQDVCLGVWFFHSDSTLHQAATARIGEADSDSASIDGLVLKRRAAGVERDGCAVVGVSVVADIHAFRAGLRDVQSHFVLLEHVLRDHAGDDVFGAASSVEHSGSVVVNVIAADRQVVQATV